MPKWSVAVVTKFLQSVRSCSRRHAVCRPMLEGFRLFSTVRVHVCLDRTRGRFQSAGGPWIAVVAPSGELRSKGRCGVFAGKTVWSTPERLRGKVLTTRRYTNLRLPLRLEHDGDQFQVQTLQCGRRVAAVWDGCSQWLECIRPVRFLISQLLIHGDCIGQYTGWSKKWHAWLILFDNFVKVHQ